MNKKIRQQVFDKYNGRCAYCGCELQNGWHVDHIEPHWHNYTEQECKKHGLTKGENSIDNYNPACPRCNKWKATYTLENFRKQIAEQVKRLNDYSSNYRMAKDYGLITENNIAVTFYFETTRKGRDLMI